MTDSPCCNVVCEQCYQKSSFCLNCLESESDICATAETHVNTGVDAGTVASAESVRAEFCTTCGLDRSLCCDCSGSQLVSTPQNSSSVTIESAPAANDVVQPSRNSVAQPRASGTKNNQKASGTKNNQKDKYVTVLCDCRLGEECFRLIDDSMCKKQDVRTCVISTCDHEIRPGLEYLL
jgi:hypothetical protein